MNCKKKEGKLRRKIIIISLVIFIILFGMLIFPKIEVPHWIKGVAKISPSREMIFARGADGEVITNIVDNRTGFTNSSKLISFDRGESVVLDIKAELKAGQVLNKGDTLGLIYSSKQQEELTQLTGNLRILQATLKARKSGKKIAEIQQAKERLALAKAEFEKQKKVVSRLKVLFDKEFCSKEKYQLANDELDILSLTIKVRQAELQSYQTGDKNEDINTVKQQIAAVEEEISFLKETIDTKNTIVAPFDCVLESSFSTDTLLILSDKLSAVAFIPVSLEKSINIKKGDKVSFYGPEDVSGLTGIVNRKLQTMQLMNGKQCILISAKIENLTKDFISGIIAKAKIDCGKQSLKNYFLNNIIK